MPGEQIGGLYITEYESTRSFGIEPASASGKGVLAPGEAGPGLNVGSYVIYSFGGVSFTGIISLSELNDTREGGREYSFQVVDNRVRLAWQWVFGVWNMSEAIGRDSERPLVRPPADEFGSGTVGLDDEDADFTSGPGSVSAPPSSPSGPSPGPTRKRLYRHIVASQWQAQMSSFTDAPVTAADIIRNAVKHAIGGYGFSFDFHGDQINKPVLGIDANNGMSLAALISAVAEAQGLQVTLDGSRTLRFERRGEGTLIIPAANNAHLVRDGFAASAEASKIRVVGDRVLVQVMNVPLEPDWKTAWEPFISEPAWVHEVAATFPAYPNDATRANQAKLAAFARQVTVRQYVEAKGADGLPFADYRSWDGASRMDIPAWVYINQILYRAYRIPYDTMLNGVSMHNLELADGLLCATELPSGADAMRYARSPVEFYPQASAAVIAKGQPIDLLRTADRSAITNLATTDFRTLWSEMPDFRLDKPNHGIRFNTPVFLDGDPATGKSIVLFPNRGEGGYQDVSAAVAADDEYLDLAVPNPGYAIGPAEVKAAFTFKLGKFFADFGTGQRWKVESVGGLTEHLLAMGADTAFAPTGLEAYAGEIHTPATTESIKEIVYEDGLSALDQAQVQADALIAREGVERSGSYKRIGAAGTAPSGVIDRVNISISREQGLSETVEFARPRPAKDFVPSREIARRIRSEALFNGQSELREEVRQLRAIALLEEGGKEKAVRSTSHREIQDLSRKPFGGDDPETAMIADPNGAGGAGGWRAGELVWLDETGYPSATGRAFGGVVVSAPPEVETTQVKFVNLATSGTVPVLVGSGTAADGGVRADPGDRSARGGRVAIGSLAHPGAVPGADETKDAVALVRLNTDAGLLPQWRVHGVRYDSTAAKYYCRVAPGWFLNPDPAVADVQSDPFLPDYEPPPPFMNYRRPFIEVADGSGGTEKLPMDTLPLPEIEFVAGDKIVCRAQTDVRDILKADESTGDPDADPPVEPTGVLLQVTAAAEDVTGTHFQPEEPDRPGVEGDYYYTLATFDISGADPADVVVKQRHEGGPIIHRPNLRTFENLGSGVGAFKERNRETDKEGFRGHLQAYGITIKQEALDIQYEFRGENAGSGCPVLIEPDDPANPGVGPAKLRRITGRGATEGDREIHVRCEPVGGELPLQITVEGNGKDGSLRFEDCNSVPLFGLYWRDGLITNNDSATITVPDCDMTT